MKTLFTLLLALMAVALHAQNTNEQLIQHIKTSNYTTVDSLLKAGANPNYQPSPTDPTPLMLAAYYSDLGMVKLLVNVGGDAKTKGLLSVKRLNHDFQYGSVLTTAAGEGRASIVNYLVDSLGLDVNEPELTLNGEQGMTPIMRAIQWAKPNACKILLERDSTVVNDLYKNGHPVFLCLGNSNLSSYHKQLTLEIILPLINPEVARDSASKTLFHYLDENFILWDFLKKHTSLINIQDIQGNTPVHNLVENKKYLFLDSLIASGATLGIKNNLGVSYTSNNLPQMPDYESKILRSIYEFNTNNERKGIELYESAANNLRKIRNGSIESYINAVTVASTLKKVSDYDLFKSYIDSISVSKPFNSVLLDIEYNTCLMVNQFRKYNYAEVDSIISRVISLSTALLGNFNKETCLAWNAKAWNEYNSRNLKGAIEATVKSKEVRGEFFGINDINYAKAVGNLGTLTQIAGEIYRSKELEKEAFEIKRRELKGKITNSFLTSLHGYVNGLIKVGEFDEAENLLNQYETVDEYEVYKEMQALLFNTRSGLMQRLGKISEAVYYLKKAIDIYDNLEIRDNNYFRILNNLFQFYIQTGSVNNARQVQEKIENLKLSDPLTKDSESTLEVRKFLFQSLSAAHSLEAYYSAINKTKLLPVDALAIDKQYAEHLVGDNKYSKADSVLKLIIPKYESLKIFNTDYLASLILQTIVKNKLEGNQAAFDYLSSLNEVIKKKQYNNLKDL